MTSVTVFEVGPRDGLQNEKRAIPTEGKLELIRALSGAGLRHVEATSFVSPAWIPRLADAEQVVAALPEGETSYSVLVPNGRGLSRLIGALGRRGPDAPRVTAAVFVSTSERHNKKNVNKTVSETLAAFEGLIGAAREAGLRVRGYVSTAFGCPYEGRVDPRSVVRVAERLLALGCEQISLGDTIGVATPDQVRRLLELLLGKVRREEVALHMHDTRGTALANVLAGLEAGITTFDSSLGGLGGCPYAPGASGNLATEDLVYMLHGMGYETGIDWEKLVAAGELAQALVGRPLPSKALQAELVGRGGPETGCVA
jgi:hydroxymethylglutaryl-CoA lyase